MRQERAHVEMPMLAGSQPAKVAHCWAHKLPSGELFPATRLHTANPSIRHLGAERGRASGGEGYGDEIRRRGQERTGWMV